MADGREIRHLFFKFFKRPASKPALRRRVERLNRLDVQVRHAGIKARNNGNEKREEKPRLTRLESWRMPSDKAAWTFHCPGNGP
jgi:hypothetical protein